MLKAIIETIGVRRPRHSKTLRPAKARHTKLGGRSSRHEGPPSRTAAAKEILSRSSAIPGVPVGNIENRRSTYQEYSSIVGKEKPKEEDCAIILSDDCGFNPRVEDRLLPDESPLQSDGHRVSAVVGLELRQDALHVRLNGGFGNGQLFGDDFIGSAPRNPA
jgi:hypothetical protein